MARRLDLAMTLMGSPRVIFLDEPTTGLDPRSRRAVWESVRELVAAGTTVFLTTQYLEEADQLADEIALLDAGRIVARGSAAELKRLVPGAHIRVEVADAGALARAAEALPSGSAEPAALALVVPGDADVAGLRRVLDALDAAAVDVTAISVHTPDLDDVFLALTA